MRQRLTAVPALALLGRDRAPEFVDDGARVAGDLVDVAFEMGGPQSQSCVASERRVASGSEAGGGIRRDRELHRALDGKGQGDTPVFVPQEGQANVA